MHGDCDAAVARTYVSGMIIELQCCCVVLHCSDDVICALLPASNGQLCEASDVRELTSTARAFSAQYITRPDGGVAASSCDPAIQLLCGVQCRVGLLGVGVHCLGCQAQTQQDYRRSEDRKVEVAYVPLRAKSLECTTLSRTALILGPS